MSGVTALIVVLPFLYSLIAAQAGEHSPDGPVARLSYSNTYGVVGENRRIRHASVLHFIGAADIEY